MTTVLIVDDELDMRLLVRMMIDLASDGLDVVGEAADGSEALDVWRALDGPPVPDVVILDNRMPQMDGLDVARTVLAERPGQIIVLYSAYLDDALRGQAAELGVSACLSKTDIDQLPDLIRSLAQT